MDTVDSKFDELDSKVDSKFDELDSKVDEINLNLVALIAALDKTGEVDAALTGVSG